jgi:hypothetical protein
MHQKRMHISNAVIHRAVKILNQQCSSFLGVVVVSFIVWLVEIESACMYQKLLMMVLLFHWLVGISMHPSTPEDDTTVINHAVVQNILTHSIVVLLLFHLLFG